MPSPSVKAKEALKKPPAAKSLRSRWIPDGDDTPKVNAIYTEMPICFSIMSRLYLTVMSVDME